MAIVDVEVHHKYVLSD